MLLFAFLVSTSFTIGKAITYSLDPAAMTFLRFTLALGIFILAAVVTNTSCKRPSSAGWGRYFFLALLLVVFFVTMFEGLRWTSSLSAGAVFTLVPLMTAILTFFLFRQTLSIAGLASLLIACLASLWIILGGDFAAVSALEAGRGETIFLIGCAAYAGYAPAVRGLHDGASLICLTLWTLLAGSIILFAYGWQVILATDWALVPATTYLGIGWLSLVTTAITLYLIHYASLRLQGTKVMAYTLLIPAFVLLQRVVLGDEWPNGSVLMALIILTGAMLVMQQAKEV